MGSWPPLHKALRSLVCLCVVVSKSETCLESAAFLQVSETCLESTAFLQVSHTTHLSSSGRTLAESINTAPDVSQRLELVKPFAFVHIAEAGSNLLNVFLGLEPLWEGCGSPRASIDTLVFCSKAFVPVIEACPGRLRLSLQPGYPEAECPACVALPSKGSCTQCGCGGCGPCGHMGAGLVYPATKGHLVATFRQPEQRLISAYNDFLFGWPATEAVPKNLLEYAVGMQGCSVKLLARSAVMPCADVHPPTSEETSLALSRLEEGFAFVGLAEEWDLSVCLFHAKFGGDCRATDFLNLIPGPANQSMYDTFDLHGFVDVADGQVYKVASRLFTEDLTRFHVTSASCTESCWSSPVA